MVAGEAGVRGKAEQPALAGLGHRHLRDRLARASAPRQDRTRPGRSVTSARPSGRNATPMAPRRPPATVFDARLSAPRAVGLLDRLGGRRRRTGAVGVLALVVAVAPREGERGHEHCQQALGRHRHSSLASQKRRHVVDHVGPVEPRPVPRALDHAVLRVAQCLRVRAADDRSSRSTHRRCRTAGTWYA